MNKPESLRSHLLNAVPALKHSDERLLVFMDNGKVRCTAAASLSFEYAYDLQIMLTEFAGHPDSVMLPLLAWVRIHQPELLANLDKAKAGIEFEADILNHNLVDLSIRLPLTERVIVRQRDDGSYDVIHAGEPQQSAVSEPDSAVQLLAQGEVIAGWQLIAAGKVHCHE